VGAGYGCYLSSHDEVARLPTLVDQFERQAFRPEILQSLISADDARPVVWVAGVKAPEVLRHVDGLEINRINQLVVEPTLQTTTRFGSAPAFVCTCSPDDRTDRSAMAVSPEKGEGSSPVISGLALGFGARGPVAGGMLYQDSAVGSR
jgi:hypothetical protein